MGTPAILVDNLEKCFPPTSSGWRALLQPFSRPTQRSLAGITFAIEQGEAVAVIGANGAGKSTLLRVLATLLLPTRGHAEIFGWDVERESAEARKHLGYLSSGDDGFYSRLTGKQNLRLFAAMNDVPKREAAKRIAEVRELLGLGDELEKQVRTLSAGMLHRLGLARAILHIPDLLLLDEPTRGLDPLAAAEFRRVLKKDLLDSNRKTLLFASHSLDEVEEIAERVAVLSAGRLAAFDTPRKLCERMGVDRLEQAFEKLAAGQSSSDSKR